MKGNRPNATGLPVVATAKGAEGLDLEDGRHLLLAKNAETFADAIAALLENCDGAETLATTGGDLVRQRYSWHAVIEALAAPSSEEEAVGASWELAPVSANH